MRQSQYYRNNSNAALAPPREVRLMEGSRKEKDTIVLTLSSSDMATTEEAEAFAYHDPPPTEMTVTIKLAGFNMDTSQNNVSVAVYLRRYMLDAVWRDASDPTETISPNSGTSISKKLYVTFYVGDRRNNIRLLKPLVLPTTSADFDMVVMRQTTVTGESASNPYATVQTTDVTSYFENQFTNQGDYFGEPGLMIGYANAQALAALRSVGKVTVVMHNDRDDQYRSPFWYYRFLAGVSMWNPEANQYDVVSAGTTRVKYYKRVKHITVKQSGGPYMPRTLYTFDTPVFTAIAPFMVEATLTNVRALPQHNYVMSNNASVTLNVAQSAVRGSTDLSAMVTGSMPSSAPSDATGYTCPLYDVGAAGAGLLDVAAAVPARLQSEPMVFPNGAWAGTPLAAADTAMPGYASPFPWEQSLDANVLMVITGAATYSQKAELVGRVIIPRHNYLFMDAGSDWNEEGGGTTTMGERSLQFDFGPGRAAVINRLEVLFPRSEEDHQPLGMGASVQRVFRSGTTDGDVPNAVWFGGFQGTRPYGSRDSSDTDKEYQYLTSHTQSTNSLYGTTATLMRVEAAKTPSSHPWSGTPTAPVYSVPQTAEVEESAASYVFRSPNALNPPLDMRRQEFGPFVRGARFGDLEDNTSVKAIVIEGVVAEWATKQHPLQHYFTSLLQFALTPVINSFYQGKALVLVNGELAEPTLADYANKTTLKYIYPTSFADTAPSPALIKDSFRSLDTYIMSKFAVYMVDTPAGAPSATDAPFTEYIVRESYFPSPYYDQYDETTESPDRPGRSAVLRPQERSRSQKMVSPNFAMGRYFGVTFGSALDKGPAARMTRGTSNQLRAFSVRPCSQLFSFETNMGVVAAPSARYATFSKRYEGGVLVAADATDLGEEYTLDLYDNQPVFDAASNDHAEALVTQNIEVVNQARAALSKPPLLQETNCTVTAVMEDDTLLGRYQSFARASSKTPLRRSADFHLAMVPMSSK